MGPLEGLARKLPFSELGCIFQLASHLKASPRVVSKAEGARWRLSCVHQGTLCRRPRRGIGCTSTFQVHGCAGMRLA